MSTAALLVAAVNGALAHLGQPPITSLDQEMHAARTAKALWRGVLDTCLVAHSWNFAETDDYVPAATSIVADARGWYRHNLPDDLLQVVRIEGLGAGDWKVMAPENPSADDAAQARRLFSRILTPTVTATWRVVNAGLWSPLFRQYYEFELGAAMAGPVGRDASKGPELRAEARLLLQPAKRRDAQEGASREMPRETGWLAARRGARR